MLNSEPIWILDTDNDSLELYHQTLGLQSALQIFKSFEDFIAAFRDKANTKPRLLIVEPAVNKDAIAQFVGASATEKNFPETIAVSDLDDIDTIRFYLRSGVRDYILKPVRPNELIAKVERSLMKLDNRSVLIFRNELDGKAVPGLTFREHQILTVLLNRPSRSVQRELLLDTVWSNTLVNRKTLDVHVFNLRRKLRPIGYDILCRDKLLILSKMPANND